ncbi:putative lipid II flippase FtsW [Sutterella massiliensis]|uniref:Probable peptidoglycan glycosyltransferase FtsW n=1 Tax=Sutterella massiliensis TaxID=1816689 RepID=A0ABS2DRH1_9BURK|nr:putative lipid II flippase FtsW [Sutterella massiliensis]MBM6703330.1 putative lipid II flippase FtsW [Sutterella massiliensis]
MIKRDDMRAAGRWDARASLEAAPSLNWEVIICVASLLAIGCVMVFSATSAFAQSPKFHVTETTFLVRHLTSIAVAVTAAAIAFRFPMSFWFRWSVPIGICVFFLLALVFMPGVGRTVNGARRWISLFGVMNLQVSEMVKVAALIFTAAFTVKKQDYMHSFLSGFFPMAFVMVLIAFLLMQQPDLGATVVIAVEIMGVLFLGGLSINIFLSVASILVVFVGWMIYATPWRFGRILAYLDPWSDEYVLGQAYQLSHSLIAFGRGELFGVGLGGSVEKLNYLPEAHTDFIMAVIAEETGFVGVILTLFIFYWLIRRAFEIGRQAVKLERPFQGLLAQGVGLWFGVQVFINVGVASGALPTKGLTLPFVSFGGSALLSSMIAVGLLLRVDRENKILMRGGQV